jgi:hypothetical protein
MQIKFSEMPSKANIKIFCLFVLALVVFSCKKNNPPVIESFITETDSVKTGSSVNFEVIVTDADNDPIQIYWVIDGKLKTEYTQKYKIIWVTPNTPGNVFIKVVVDDGTVENSVTKTLFIF